MSRTAGFACLILALARPAAAHVIHVPGDDFTIQKAISHAVNGDEIVVAPGTYFENIDFLGKALTLRSEEGPQVTTIDGNTGTVVQFFGGEGRDTVLQGFTITDGSGSALAGSLRGGAMYIDSGSPTVVGCVFHDNHVVAAAAFGGAVYGTNASPLFVGCTFAGNSALGTEGPSRGGAVCFEGGIPVFVNCLFHDNHAQGPGVGGGAVSLQDSGAAFVSCTMAGNLAGPSPPARGAPAGVGGGIAVVGPALPTVSSCILAANGGSTEAFQIEGAPTVQYSFVQGWSGALGGAGNIGAGPADPMLADPASGDLRLLAGSPCIDAGDTTVVAGGACVALDLDGHTRLVDDPASADSGVGPAPMVDMGAYEFGAGPGIDCDNNALDDSCEINAGLAFDCNGNGALDRCDLNDPALDADRNDILDACQALGDGNGDGVVDVTDLLRILATWGPCAGCAEDSNQDGVVDVADLLTLLANWD